MIFDENQKFLGIYKSEWIIVFISFISYNIICLVSHIFSKIRFPKYNELSRPIRGEWLTRVPSTLHAGLAATIAIYLVATNNELSESPVKHRAFESITVFCISAGYFWADAIFIIFFKLEPIVPILCHHAFASFGFLTAVSEHGGEGIWFGTCLLITEVSTVFNNWEWYLQKLEVKSNLKTFVEIIYTVSWLIFRILINPYLLYKVWIHWELLLDINVYCGFFLGLNMMFLMLLNNYYFITGPFYGYIFRSSIKEEEIEKKKKGH
eukprot:TRINITY_DN15714_c0_g1_i1.p1 TRINITY_DN15714_c0_g1~~TRINITY_DN15714_c0_g1_i1.p1  ORF type:complete len:265 (-),score=44.28 TRINITY_DN15714_c0_g1_i1:245-1039(-)